MKVERRRRGRFALMNDSPLWPDRVGVDARQRAAERIGSEIETGTVYMNRCDYLDPACLDRGEGDRPRRAAVADRLRDAHAPEKLSLRKTITMELRGNWNYPTSVRFGAGRSSELAMR
jgi:hypothetical protein